MLSKYAMENLKTLAELAAAGDAAAQYRLAAHYDREGRKDDARHWTAKAAAAGHPGALYTQATELLSAPPGEMRVSDAVAMLQRAAKAGGAAALRQLAVLTALGLGVKRDWAGAVKLLSHAAKAGYPPAMRELAVLAAMAAYDGETGAALLRAATLNGDWIALYLALRRGNVLSAQEGAGLALKLRNAGVPFAKELNDPSGGGVTDEAIDFEDMISKAAGIGAKSVKDYVKVLNADPDIFCIEHLLSAEECGYLVCSAAPLLTPSKVVDPEKSSADHAQYRTSDGAMFGLLDLDLVLIGIYARLAKAVGVPLENCELMGVLRYLPGQEYKPHHDFLPEDAADYSEVKRSGQRIRTLIVSLNDGFQGGKTIFPNLGLSYCGKRGDAVLFHNTDDQETPYLETLHAGEPVTSGEKWIVTLWCRAKPFWFWV